MKNYEITFEWPNGDWTWIYAQANDFHQAMLIALDKCPLTCRVHGILFMTSEQVKANEDSARQRGAFREGDELRTTSQDDYYK